ncbi:LysR family transcriptional regulator [Litorivivens sp.]|uniref:LysR family transcriptional regulator n=1 Tax=Litorivivens sp. TaxID=2020868 RepID=UPI0035621048
MQNLDWNDIQYCLAVVKEGSVTAAARSLDVNHTTVSRRITALEKQLNVRLFDRSTAGWLITPVGESVLKSAESIAEEVSNIQRQVLADSQELSGILKVTAVDLTIQRVLQPGIKAFCEKYPDIAIELIASEDPFNLSVHEADIAFRVTNDPPPNVLGKKIADFAYGVYATHELAERIAKGSKDVGAILWLLDQRRPHPQWKEESFPELPVRYRVNSLNVAYELTRHGHGIAQLPTGLGELDPLLTKIPCEHVDQPMGFWVLSHIDLRTTARIRIFRDFMLEAIAPRIPMLEGKVSAKDLDGIDVYGEFVSEK